MSLINGGIDKLPGWAKVITVLGFPGFVALFLLGQSAGIIPSEVQRLIEFQKTHNETVMAHVMRTDDLARSVRLAAKIMCQNAASNERPARLCDTIP